MTGPQLGVGYRTRPVEVERGVTLQLDIWQLSGDGAATAPGFLLVHGLASNARLYDGLAARLVAAGHRAAAVDLRGHGRSDKPDEGYDYDTLTTDLGEVLAFLKRQGWEEPPVVVGQSFGGNLVLELAARRPEAVTGVACIDGGTIDLKRRFSNWESASEALTPPKTTGTDYVELKRRFSDWHPDWPPEAIEGSLANFELRTDGTVAPFLSLERHMKIVRSMWDFSPTASYPEISVPVLLLPVDSPGAPAQWAEAKHKSVKEALGALEQAEVCWLSGDHDVHAQHPDEVAAVLLSSCEGVFTSRSSPSGGANELRR